MYELSIETDFAAAHNLRGYEGACERLHGHNWKVEVEIASSRLNNLSMVCDFKEIKKKLGGVLNSLDHAYLNKLAYFKKYNPTSEKIAEYIYFKLKKLVKGKDFILKSITVWESDSSCAKYSEEADV